jgi:hypothetical protein
MRLLLGHQGVMLAPPIDRNPETALTIPNAPGSCIGQKGAMRIRASFQRAPIRPSVWLVTLLLVTACSGEYSEEAGAAMLAAAERGDLTTLDGLLRRDVSVDVRDSCRWTPLMKAALNGHREAVERLLAFGSAVDAGDSGGYTALMLAASNDHAGIVELLLQHGADINHVESTNGWTALIWAAKRGHEETVATLVDYGAERSVRDHRGLTARTWAQQADDPGIAAMLDQAVD